MHHGRSSLDSSSERNNYFVLIRLVACLGIVFAHSYTIRDGVDWAVAGTRYTIYSLAQMGLYVFFCASGYLVTGSILSKRSIVLFSLARYLRLAPALLVVSLIIAFAIGPLCTTMPLAEYFSSQQTWQYPILTGLTFYDKFQLPGVFGNFREAFVVNIPIWTLKYELLFYAFTAAIFALGLLNKRAVVLLAGTIFLVFAGDEIWFGYANEIISLNHLRAFLICYLTGTTFWIYREKIHMNWLVVPVLIGAALMVQIPVLIQVVQAVAITYTLLTVAYANRGGKRKIEQDEDYSYGIYIMHWPVFSMLLTFWPEMPHAILLISGLAMVVPLAILSWHFVEKPALKLLPKSTALKIPQRLKLA